MKSCASCGKASPDGANICPHCGAPLEQGVPKKKHNTIAWILVVSLSVVLLLGGWLLGIEYLIQKQPPAFAASSLGDMPPESTDFPERQDPIEVPEEHETFAYVVLCQKVYWNGYSFEIPADDFALVRGQVEGVDACAVVTEDDESNFEDALDEGGDTFTDYMDSSLDRGFAMVLLTDESTANQMIRAAELRPGRTYIHVTRVFDSDISWYGYTFENEAGYATSVIATQRPDGWSVVLTHKGSVDSDVCGTLLDTFSYEAPEWDE